ncbi:hypothetical protein TRICHSKD4_5129 [Roseibium sp. TrichSKD4]|uniref:hypothetical protein n=1 Tax=Roseibium sp. TrichSKD4 TaxID=744980 RepID=UPI0001E574C0|nr:hypothetical protein [Roseibium sp. TrichSKD4]EFO29303.1 hypothetical protein TRICHSKD4_5129 [Roseibium sp. TrichSKD4]
MLRRINSLAEIWQSIVALVGMLSITAAVLFYFAQGNISCKSWFVSAAENFGIFKIERCKLRTYLDNFSSAYEVAEELMGPAFRPDRVWAQPAGDEFKHILSLHELYRAEIMKQSVSNAWLEEDYNKRGDLYFASFDLGNVSVVTFYSKDGEFRNVEGISVSGDRLFEDYDFPFFRWNHHVRAQFPDGHNYPPSSSQATNYVSGLGTIELIKLLCGGDDLVRDSLHYYDYMEDDSLVSPPCFSLPQDAGDYPYFTRFYFNYVNVDGGEPYISSISAFSDNVKIMEQVRITWGD